MSEGASLFRPARLFEGMLMFLSAHHKACLSLFFVFVSNHAMAGLSEDVHKLLSAEQFKEAQERVQAVLDASRGTEKPALIRRLEALNLLVDVWSAFPGNELDETSGAWIEQATTLTQSLYGDKSRQLAKLLITGAVRKQRLSARNSTAKGLQSSEKTAVVAQCLDLLEHGTGVISAVDQAIVYSGASNLSGDEHQALAFVQRGDAFLQHPQTSWELRQHAWDLALLGYEYDRTGDGAKGLANARAGVALAARVTGRDTVFYARTLFFLGQIQMFHGDYVGAQITARSVLEILRARSTQSNLVDTKTQALKQLGGAMVELGDYDGARPVLEEAVNLLDGATNDAPKPMLPGSLNELALLEKQLGNLPRARELLQRALVVFEQLQGQQALRLIPILVNLGNVELLQNDLDAADSHYRRAEEILKATGGEYGATEVQDGLAQVAFARAEPVNADAILGKTITKLAKSYGDQHPSLLTLRCEQALAEARMGKDDEAYELAESGERFRSELLNRIAPALPEKQSLDLKSKLTGCTGLLLALAQRSHKPQREMSAWQIVTETRGLATRLRGIRLTAARNSANQAGKERWSQWQRAADGYADVLLKSSKSRETLDTARNAFEKAEADLINSTAISAKLLEHTQPIDVLLLLQPAGSTIVSYVKTPNFDVSATARSTFAKGEVLYAFVKDHESIRMVALGDNTGIEAKIAHWHELLRKPGSDLVELADAGRAVRSAIWDPLNLDAGQGHVLIVPDGALYRVNFAALPDGDGFLVEHGWRVHTLESENDLALSEAAAGPQHLLLLGAPDFGELVQREAQPGLCDAGFTALPGTKIEIDGLAQLWSEVYGNSPTVLTGRNARKDTLRADAAKNSVIHLATHAMDVGHACTPASLVATRRISLVGLAKQSLGSSAALALAGANKYFTEQDTRGILSSEDAVTMSLDHTQWVILAACDTGLGEVIDGEGAFGLRRAFRLAGAQTVIMSLWEVDDNATAALMQELYRARLQQQMNTMDAIAQAEQAVLSARRTAGESTHPFYWAAFIASGSWH